MVETADSASGKRWKRMNELEREDEMEDPEAVYKWSGLELQRCRKSDQYRYFLKYIT